MMIIARKLQGPEATFYNEWILKQIRWRSLSLSLSLSLFLSLSISVCYYNKASLVIQWRRKVPKSGGGGGGGGTQTRDLCRFGKEPIWTSCIWI